MKETGPLSSGQTEISADFATVLLLDFVEHFVRVFGSWWAEFMRTLLLFVVCLLSHGVFIDFSRPCGHWKS